MFLYFVYFPGFKNIQCDVFKILWQFAFETFGLMFKAGFLNCFMALSGLLNLMSDVLECLSFKFGIRNLQSGTLKVVMALSAFLNVKFDVLKYVMASSGFLHLISLMF